jgi:hypothetical protein
MLVSELIDRTYNAWLYPAGIHRPTFDTLTNALTNSAGDKTVTVDGRLTGKIPKDSVLEIDDELILLDTVDNLVLTAHERGYLETDVASHTADTRVYVDPRFPRKVVFNQLVSIIGGLYSKGIYQRTTSTDTYDSSQVKTLPAGTKELLSVVVKSTGSYETYTVLNKARHDYQVYQAFSPPKVQLLRGGAKDAVVTYVLKKDFTLPTSTSDDLTTTCGVSATLAPHLAQAAAGELLQARELPRVQIEEVRRFLATQGVQVGAALNVGQAMLQDFDRRHVGAERRRQSELDPTSMEFVPLR